MIRERTRCGTYSLVAYDNGSDVETKSTLLDLHSEGLLEVLILDTRNTGCLYNKLVFHAMVTKDERYYCVTDNDVYPPKLDPDWLSSMLQIMDRHPNIALLTPQLPPQWLQTPYGSDADVIYAKAVGNTFKICRTEALKQVVCEVPQSLGSYGDDGLISRLLEKNGWKIAFCRDIWCYHAGQCKNWGYRLEEVAKDPRKVGYGEPFVYEFEDEQKYIPKEQWRLQM